MIEWKTPQTRLVKAPLAIEAFPGMPSTLNPSGPTLPLDPSFLSPLFTALGT